MDGESSGRVVVTVDREHLQDIQGVADALRSAGMRVDRILPTVGVIGGEVAQDGVHALESVAGVLGVEPDGEMRAI